MHDAPAIALAPLTTLTTLTSVSPLLVDTRQLCALLHRSKASLERDDAAGRIPRALRLHGSKRWRVGEIQEWVQAGCPSRAEWEARQKARRS